MSDGGDTVRRAKFGPEVFGERVPDWIHAAMRFQNLIQIAKGLPEGEEWPTQAEIARNLEELRSHFEQWYPSLGAANDDGMRAPA